MKLIVCAILVQVHCVSHSSEADCVRHYSAGALLMGRYNAMVV